MLKHDAGITVSRPIEEVFGFLSNPENFPLWQSGVTESRLLSDAPLRVGTRFTEVVRVMGRPLQAVCEITEYDQPHKMAFRTISDTAIQYQGAFSFESHGDATRLNIQAVTILKGFWRLVEPLFGAEVKKELDGELKTIKRVLESMP